MFDGFLETWSVVGAETTGVGIECESVGEEIGLPVVVLVNLTVVGEGVSIKRVNMAGALRIHAGSIFLNFIFITSQSVIIELHGCSKRGSKRSTVAS